MLIIRARTKNRRKLSQQKRKSRRHKIHQKTQ